MGPSRARRPKAEGRKPKAAESTGPLIKMRCRRRITAAPCRAAANTAPPLTIGAPNRIPLAYADRYGYYTQNATITLRVWRVKARCSGSYRSNDRRILRFGSRTSARARSICWAADRGGSPRGVCPLTRSGSRCPEEQTAVVVEDSSVRAEVGAIAAAGLRESSTWLFSADSD